MRRERIVGAYLAFVGVPLLVMLGVLHFGRHLPAPVSAAGRWDLEGDFSSAGRSPEAALLTSVKQPAFAITQSARDITFTVNNAQRTVLRGRMSDSSLTAGNSTGQAIDDPQPLYIEATLSGKPGSRIMTGTIRLNGCPSCQLVSFHATQEAVQQGDTGQLLVPRVLTIIIQIAVIIIAVRAFGFVFKLIGQPQVIGEMVAGILLGPSLLGWVAPQLSAMLFPDASLSYLNTISQVGIVIYMFLVGLELNPGELKGQGEAAVLTSHVSIVVPFALGSLTALFLYPRLANDGVSLTTFALFMGAAMSVTAFPVLARILTDRGMLGSRLAALAIACAAVDDVTGWCIVAYITVMIHAQSSATPVWLTVAGSIGFVFVMIFGVRPLLRRLRTHFEDKGWLSENAIALVLLLVLASASITERLGIHLLFGAFLAGVIMPKNPAFSRHILQKFESLTVVLLLPIYFAYTGLRMNLKGLNGAHMWLYCGVIILVAITGKLAGSMIALRATGKGWRDAAGLGILLNTRGLMALVILNIGLDLGVISPALFAMMALMALVTTFMTTPLLEWVYPIRLIREEVAAKEITRRAADARALQES